MTQHVFKTSVPVVFMALFVIGSLGMPNTAKAGCNKDLSSPGECWTNCKTEDDITICDIIKLDTFMPESPGGGQTHFKSEDRVFSGKFVTKTYSGNKAAKGRVMVRKK